MEGTDMQNDELEPLFSIPQVGLILGFEKSTIYDRIKTGKSMPFGLTAPSEFRAANSSGTSPPQRQFRRECWLSWAASLRSPSRCRLVRTHLQCNSPFRGSY
jgi:hypothetical protein